MWLSKRHAYLDYAGAVPVRAAALSVFNRAQSLYGNPGALHSDGVRAATALEEVRSGVAAVLGCKASEIVLTSGGTEGNNLAILGVANALEREGNLAGSHFLISSIEHPSVLEAARSLEARGVRVSYCEPDEKGMISAESVAALLTEETRLVSVGWANGEIGTLQPLAAITRAIRSFEKECPGSRVVVHSDLGQAPLYYSPQVHTLGVDLATIDGGKVGSVRGVGALFIKRGTPLSPILFGGKQERGLRPGTENGALAASLAAALKEAAHERENESKRLAELREECIQMLMEQEALDGFVVNGQARAQMPSILNISISNISNEYVTLALDAAGFSIATKSACQEGERISHVVAAVAPSEAWRAENALRISFGKETKKADIKRFAQELTRIVARLRAQAALARPEN